MAAGFLYVLANPSMPGLVKVGKTERDPSARAKELSSVTGVPTPFMLVYSQAVEDCDAAERWVHVELERQGFRLNQDREFFNCQAHEAVQIVVTASGVRGDCTDTLNVSSAEELDPSALAEQLYDLAQKYEEGKDDTLRNDARALALYEQAAALDGTYAGLAASVAGRMYLYPRGAANSNLEKALAHYRKAVSLGMHYDLAHVAAVFMAAGQRTDAEGYWVKYFDWASNVIQADDKPALKLASMTVPNDAFMYCIHVTSGKLNHVANPHALVHFADAIKEKAWNSRNGTLEPVWEEKIKAVVRFLDAECRKNSPPPTGSSRLENSASFESGTVKMGGMISSLVKKIFWTS